MFNESNTEDFIRDLLCGPPIRTAREPASAYGREHIARASTSLGWVYISSDQLPRAERDVLVEAHLREALIRLNPEIAERPDRADEVLYRLRAILLSVQSDGLVRANEEFTAWLRGERTTPFGPNNQHTTVRLIDFDDLTRNHCVVTTQFTIRAGHAITRRPDLVLLVNGIPLVVGECKTPVRPAVSWVDGAAQIQDDYEVNVPTLFVPNVFSFATEGKTYRFGAIRMPLEIWAPWRDDSPSPRRRGGRGEVKT
jgi:type I restriction enzyme R subunit